MNPRPCTAAEAVSRAKSLVIRGGGQYILGTGDWCPTSHSDLPWTERAGQIGSDCAGFAISWCYKLPRHRPGFNIGPWASVADDLNCNSAIEDADHQRDLFQRVYTPEVGDLLMYPTFHLASLQAPFIGHVVIVTGVGRAAEWDSQKPEYGLLDVAECHGPNGHTPGVVANTGAGFQRHAATWPKPEHTTRLLRVLP